MVLCLRCRARWQFCYAEEGHALGQRAKIGTLYSVFTFDAGPNRSRLLLQRRGSGTRRRNAAEYGDEDKQFIACAVSVSNIDNIPMKLTVITVICVLS